MVRANWAVRGMATAAAATMAVGAARGVVPGATEGAGTNQRPALLSLAPGDARAVAAV